MVSGSSPAKQLNFLFVLYKIEAKTRWVFSVDGEENCSPGLEEVLQDLEAEELDVVILIHPLRDRLRAELPAIVRLLQLFKVR